MDVRAYIESGILDAVANGTATDQEMRAAQCLSKIYPEVRQALDEAEERLEVVARSYAITPPLDLKSKIMLELQNHKQDPIPDAEAIAEEPTKSAKVIELNKPRKTINVWSKMAVAAAVLAFVFGVWQYYESELKSAEIAALEQDKSALEERYEAAEMQLAALNEDMESMYNPNTAKVVMKPVMEGVLAEVSVFWDKNQGGIKLDPTSLPELPADKQYQMWALIDGKPLDLGIIPKDASGALVASKQTMRADAFTLTIEPLGGKAEPSLDQLIVIGYLS
jgi:anti-sigma-K factor RskA